MTTFEISGESITGGSSDTHNESLMTRVKNLEGYAIAIGKTLGMASLDRAFINTETISYGFRFAVTSEEKFDARGIELNESIPPSQLIEKLT